MQVMINSQCKNRHQEEKIAIPTEVNKQGEVNFIVGMSIPHSSCGI